jgi:sigma-B regulation protein RsbU (phosphoserine phosphatase)
VLGKIGTLAHFAPLVSALERELSHLHRLGEQLNHYFNEIDQEMRLAGRLQRDFLPRQLPAAAPFSFHVVYRPASWVSGDMYDVFRIDASHVGLFVADAMGHGVSAGLLTMFFRQAFLPRRADGDAPVSPPEALLGLHDALLQQKLPHSHFVTAVYAVLDTADGTVRLSRGGHPYVLHVPAPGVGGAPVELRCEGGLLGLADIEAEFEELSVRLAPGEKLVFYTDGVEDYLLQPRVRGQSAVQLREPIAELCRLPAAQLAAALEQDLDQQAGSLHQPDDITLLVVERAAADADSRGA